MDIYKILVTNSKSLVNKLELVSGDDVDAVFKYYSHDFILYFCKTSEEGVDAKVSMNTCVYQIMMQPMSEFTTLISMNVCVLC